jgi:4-diphosphocytidyl-2-C-methyl-D-erythritol kinase
MTVEAFAPAKINLTLHVTGRRADGYHLLDSLVGFAAVGDRITVAAARETSLTVTGPFAADVPQGSDNLVLKAAALMEGPAKITLDKMLPVASGIGGGSADAAATLRALAKLSGQPLPPTEDVLSLGADVPVCLAGGLVRMQGIGERLTPCAPSLRWPMVLVNPGVALSTGSVFGALHRVDNPPMADEIFDEAYEEFPDWLATQRNDLEVAAMGLAPVIADVLEAVRAEPGCRMARMSGSGATVFGLFDTADQAREAACALEAAHGDWWVKAAVWP